MSLNTNLNAATALMFRSQLIRNMSITLTVENGYVKNLDGTSPLAQLRDMYQELKETRDENAPSNEQRLEHLMKSLKGDPRGQSILNVVGMITGKSPEELASQFLKERPVGTLFAQFNEEMKEVEGLIEKSIPEDSEESVGCGDCEGCHAAAAFENSIKNGGVNFGESLKNLIEAIGQANDIKKGEDQPEPLIDLAKLFGRQTQKEPNLSKADVDILMSLAKDISSAFTTKLIEKLEAGLERDDERMTIVNEMIALARTAGLTPEDLSRAADEEEAFNDDIGLTDALVSMPVDALKGLSKEDISKVLQQSASSAKTPEELAENLKRMLTTITGQTPEIRMFSGKAGPEELKKFLANAR